MPFQIIRNDITKVECDAIVNAANTTLLGGGGVDGAIHDASGPELLAECRTLGGCNPGDAKITKGYKLPAKYVIHTVGPIWNGGHDGEDAILSSCYRRCLNIAVSNNCESVAFPLISSGAYGYPKDKALAVATDVISEFLQNNELMIYLVVYDRTAFSLSKEIADNVREYIDQNYIDKERAAHHYTCNSYDPRLSERRSRMQVFEQASRVEVSKRKQPRKIREIKPDKSEKLPEQQLEDLYVCGSAIPHDFVKDLDVSFVEMLLMFIDEKGYTDVECYKRANIDRKLFSKMKNTKNYRPKKKTALAFAIALKLSVEETNSLLEKCGYILSRSDLFDVIVQYHIENKIYDIFSINEVLFSYDLELLGS